MRSSLHHISAVLLLITLSGLCGKTAAAVKNSYNFMCDRSPQQHDRILRDAIMNLERGDTKIIYAICMHLLSFLSHNNVFSSFCVNFNLQVVTQLREVL